MKDNKHDDGFVCCHKFLSYLLLPIRILILLPFTILLGVVITLCNYNLLPHDLCHFLLKGYTIILTTICGINIHISEDKAYEKYKLLSDKEKYIVAYNHITGLDIPILFHVLKPHITFVANKNMVNLFPISSIFRFLEGIGVEVGKKTNVTKKINDHLLSNKKTTLCIAPGSADLIPDGEVINNFKTGSFVNKNKILPLLIRYQLSHREKHITWNTPENTDKNLLQHVGEVLLDGNIDVYIKFLEMQEYDEDKFKTPRDYADSVHKKMSDELKKLPKQKNNLDSIVPTDINCIFFVTISSLIISFIALFLSDYELAFHTLLTAFTGFLFHSFPTNNTLLFDKLFTFYGGLKLVWKYNNTQSGKLIKYILLFHSVFNHIKNNLQETLPTARGTTDWLHDHLYCVQLPVIIAVFWSLIDNNFFLSK